MWGGGGVKYGVFMLNAYFIQNQFSDLIQAWEIKHEKKTKLGK